MMTALDETGNVQEWKVVATCRPKRKASIEQPSLDLDSHRRPLLANQEGGRRTE